MIVLDTSAIPAVLMGEEEAVRDREASGAVASAGAAVELVAVASRDDDPFSAAQASLDEPFISIELLNGAQAVATGRAYRRYGKGHEGLSDIFAYILARETNLPLPFKGGDRTEAA